MLGNRRCGTLRSLFLDAYSFRANSTKEEEKINIIINETPEVNELKYDKKLISTVDPKRERFAVIDIGYILSVFIVIYGYFVYFCTTFVPHVVQGLK